MEKKMSYLDMVIAAIPAIKDRKGASRMAIASWIQKTYSKEGGGVFNGSLRTALNKGLEKGMLVPGATDQRYKIGVLPKVVKKKPASKKKKKSSSKKKTSSKKKKTATKKKTASKKKGSSKKKKTSSKKKKTGSKKKAPTKKRTGSKKKSSSKKKTGSKKK